MRRWAALAHAAAAGSRRRAVRASVHRARRRTRDGPGLDSAREVFVVASWQEACRNAGVAGRAASDLDCALRVLRHRHELREPRRCCGLCAPRGASMNFAREHGHASPVSQRDSSGFKGSDGPSGSRRGFRLGPPQGAPPLPPPLSGPRGDDDPADGARHRHCRHCEGRTQRANAPALAPAVPGRRGEACDSATGEEGGEGQPAGSHRQVGRAWAQPGLQCRSQAAGGAASVMRLQPWPPANASRLACHPRLLVRRQRRAPERRSKGGGGGHARARH
mmetsp:Transcript_11582/g.44988  ORF Transcript_11582/g.44988 Transcript_11582/m.44988 type:complete len:277 (+) Transcript_11582:1188-2018(+)